MRNALFTLFCFACAAILLLLCVEQGRADVVVSNLNATVADSATIIHGPQTFQAYAQEFMTGSQAEDLTDVVASLGSVELAPAASAFLDASVGGLPGDSALTTFSVPAIGSTFSDLTFTPNSTVDLSANTDYWFVLIASGAGNYQWQYTNTLSASLPNFASSIDGVNWAIGTLGGPFLIEVDASSSTTAAPLPSSAAGGLVLLGGLGLTSALRARKRRLA